MFLGPGLALLVLLLPASALTPEAQRLSAIVVFVVVLWLTEAIPMPATALLGVAAALIWGVATPRLVVSAFTDPIIALIIGSFILARALQVHGVDQRLASACVTHPWVGGRPARLLWALGVIAWLLAMWIGITACVAILFPIVMAVGQPSHGSAASEGAQRWQTGLLLMLVYAASAGAMATPVGTPPNLIGIALMRDLIGVSISFLDWMRVGVPLALALLVSRYALVLWRYLPSGHALAVPMVPRRPSSALPDRWTTGQRNSLAAFMTAIALWMAPGLAVLLLGRGHPAVDALQTALSPGLAALIAVGLLLLLPAGAGRATLSWRQAVRIDWGTVVLFGGGIALGRMMVDTGLARHLGRWLFSAAVSQHPARLAGLASLAAVIMSEFMSNTAAANLLIPMVVSAAVAAPAHAVLASVIATLAASLGFMLPVSTPSLAMIYGSGGVRLADMVKTGLLVDVLGWLMVWALGLWLVPLVLTAG